MSFRVRQHAGKAREEFDPELLVDAGGKRVEPAENDVDIDAPCILHGLDLAGKLGGRSLVEGHARHELGLGFAIVFEWLLHERQRAADIDDVERHGAFWQRQDLPEGAGRLHRGKAGDAADQAAPRDGCVVTRVTHWFLPLTVF